MHELVSFDNDIPIAIREINFSNRNKIALKLQILSGIGPFKWPILEPIWPISPILLNLELSLRNTDNLQLLQ